MARAASILRAGLLLSAVAVSLAVPAHAQQVGGAWETVLTMHGPAPRSHLGADIEVMDDIDQDGVPEIAVGMPGHRPW